MSDVTPSRIGDINAGGSDAYQLFLKVYAGEVQKVFLESLVMRDKVTIKRIMSGKSAQFPVIGDATASFHVAGEDLFDSGNSYATEFLHNEVVINVDPALIANCMIPEIDEAMNHYDVRKPYAEMLGHALAKQWDTFALRAGVLAARDSALITGGDAGEVITDADADTNGASLVESILTALQKLDEKNVPMEDRFCFITPAQYRLLLSDQTNNPSMFNLDRDIGADGSFSKGVVGHIGGARIVKTNLLPTTNIASAVAGARNTYHGNFSTTKALVMHKDAVGAVILKDMAVEGERDIRTQGHLMVASEVSGIAPKRPEAAVEIKTS